MAARWQLAVMLCMILAARSALHADIYRWETGELIPGTERITPGPGVQLDHRELEYAGLSDTDLTTANSEASYHTNALLSGSTLTMG